LRKVALEDKQEFVDIDFEVQIGIFYQKFKNIT